MILKSFCYIIKTNIFFKALYRSAREHLKKSEVTSDLASEEECGRGKRQRTTVLNTNF